MRIRLILDLMRIVIVGLREGLPELKIDPKTLKLLRERRLYSQEEFAIAAGMSVRTVQRAEMGMPVSAETLKSFAAVLEVPTTRLLAPKPLPSGFWIGVCGGAAGIFVGTVGAVYAAVQGTNNEGDLGAALGVIFAACGISSALLGTLTNKFRKSHETPPPESNYLGADLNPKNNCIPSTK